MHDSNDQNKQVRVGIYARSAIKNPSAITRQIANCKQIAHERGWEIDDRYTFQDDGFSGLKTVGRPGLEQLLAAIRDRASPITHLLIEDTSRLGRDFQTVAKILDTLTAWDVSVHVAGTNVELSSPTGRKLPVGLAQN